MKTAIRKNAPFLQSCAGVTIFYLFFTKLILKSDDGHFLGIIREPGFRLTDWLSERYTTVSGRLLCEFLTAVFLRADLIFWKIFCILLWIAVLAVLLRLIAAFGEDAQKSQSFAACLPFTALLSCLNPAAFWFSGSFTYFIPFACCILCCAPAAMDLFGASYRKVPLVLLSFAVSAFACSQEQSAAITLSLMGILLLFLAKNRALRPAHFLPLLPAGIMTFLLFSAPGMRGRETAETGSFPAFATLSLPEKIGCGLSNYCGFTLLMSLVVFGVFAALLIAALRQNVSRGEKRCAAIYGGFAVFTCIVLNACYIFARHRLPEKGWEAAFQTGQFCFWDLLLLACCLCLLAFTLLLLLLLAKRDQKHFLPVLICFCAAVCSGVVLGFSSSVYASGQRVFFFSEMFLFLASCFLFSRLQNGRCKTVIHGTVVFTASLTFLVNCLTFCFLETPIMG